MKRIGIGLDIEFENVECFARLLFLIDYAKDNLKCSFKDKEINWDNLEKGFKKQYELSTMGYKHIITLDEIIAVEELIESFKGIINNRLRNDLIYSLKLLLSERDSNGYVLHKIEAIKLYRTRMTELGHPLPSLMESKLFVENLIEEMR